VVAKHLKTPWQLIHLATKEARSKDAGDIAATRYAIGVAMVLDHLDDQRVALSHAMKTNRVAIAKDILTDVYEIEYELRDRIDRLEKSDWGHRLDQLMAAIATDLQIEFKTLPENIHHILGSRTLHRHQFAPGLLAFLMRKGRDALAAARPDARG
jgi:hypothetical protein